MMELTRKQGAHITIPYKITISNTFATRLKGFMFRRKPIYREGMFIKPCKSIHTFFMFFPIDILILDGNHSIIYIKENMRPWTFIYPVKGGKAALELPKGTVQDFEINIGDKVVVKKK
ncbi:DUF192 domain-containing protein [Salirhabdus salicampi]|uniref:DUF192 domain-containing protein n=1 Tax=Salirhabdus salicampi TaxID=476102 RepID=UPI0020C45677|nr:DUF192 domain-containing protein [Salirhabdus salicampi]MCP8616128.1 DUF192 domain-containing protein [Salirhabdus salicampi]